MVATLALFLWPVVMIWLFLTRSSAVALSVSVIGGYLLLPGQTGFNLPMFPKLEKDSIPILMAGLVMLVGLRRDKMQEAGLSGLLPRTLTGQVLVLLMFVAAFMTTFTNMDRLVYGADTVLQGLGPYDAFSAALSTLITILPLLLARKFLYSPEHHRALLVVFAISGLLYTFLALVEILISPQLNRMVYGFFPASWAQHVRDGGYRPLVFLHHGLWLAIFFACALIAACGWLRLLRDGLSRWPVVLMILWIFTIMVLSNSFGALAIAILLAPVALFFTPRLQLLIAGVIAAAVLTYPLLRQADLMPVQPLVEAIRPYEPQRAASLQYRVNNEDILLEKATERFLFGWGGWGRFRVFDEETGRDISTTDGRWVIVLGQGGMARYLAEFGLCALPILILAWRRKRETVGLATSVLALVMAANLIDMIPNATSTPLTWLVAGALLGRLEYRVPVTAAGEVPLAAGPPQDLSLASGRVEGAYTRQTRRHDRKSSDAIPGKTPT